MADTLLDIVNDKGEIIGQAYRSEIHAKGLLHQEVRVWFITPKKEIILQQRGMNKDINPGLLTVTAAGHVEAGSTHDKTAFIETKEETNKLLQLSDLHCVGTRIINVVDPVTKNINHALQKEYCHLFKENIETLEVETADSDGFVVLKWDDAVNPSPALLAKTQPGVLQEEFNFVRATLESLVP